MLVLVSILKTIIVHVCAKLMMEKYHQFKDIARCTNFTLHQLKAINLVNSVPYGLGCGVVFSLMLAVLICARAYSTVLQRLFLYCLVISLSRQIVIFAMIEYQWYYTGQEKVCAMLGFLLNWIEATYNLMLLEIIIYMLFQVYCAMKTDSLPNFLKLKCTRGSLEFM